MGISDDIKPKKVYNFKYRSKSAPAVVGDKKDGAASAKGGAGDPASAKSKIHRDEKEILGEGEEKERLEDDFFRPLPKRKEAKQPKHEPKKHSCLGKIVIILIILAIIGLLVVQNLDLIKSKIWPNTTTGTSPTKDEVYDSSKTTGTEKSTTETPAATTPAVTIPAPATVDKTALKIEVLNGNGISKSAAEVSDILTAAGFTVSKTANARKFSYPSTIIYFKTGQDAAAALVKATLPTKSCTVENSDIIVGNYDIVVVVGKT